MKIEVSAIAGLTEFLDAAPQVSRQAAALAMNDITGGKGLTRYKKSIRSQVAFPGGYLEAAEKIGQTSFATPSRLETRISARQRATSLARFATGVVGGEGATVRVKAGRSVRLRKAFMVRLRAGTALDDDGRVVLPLLDQLGGDLRRRTQLRLKGRAAFFDALVVDGRNGWGIRQPGQPHCGGVGIGHSVLSCLGARLIQASTPGALSSPCGGLARR